MCCRVPAAPQADQVSPPNSLPSQCTIVLRCVTPQPCLVQSGHTGGDAKYSSSSSAPNDSYRLNSVAQKRYVGVLTPRTCAHGCIWAQGLRRCNEVKMRSYWILVSPNSVTSVPLRTGGLGHKCRRRPCKYRGRNWSDAPTGQGTPRTARNH